MSTDRLRLDLGHSHFDIIFDNGAPVATAYTDREGQRTTRSSECLEAELLRFAAAIIASLAAREKPP